jgi:uncharacterized repeat protein (TIGR03943 family)
VIRVVALALWGVVLLQSSLSGRLDLLLRGVFHPLVALSGVLLLLLAALQLPRGGWRLRERLPWPWLVSSGMALAVLLLPPNPSFSQLAANRPAQLEVEPALDFLLPPAQRSLTDWVRLLRSQPDPELYAGDPVRISGFVLAEPGQPPQLARLLVRCCLAGRCNGRLASGPAPTSGWPCRGVWGWSGWPADRPAAW